MKQKQDIIKKLAQNDDDKILLAYVLEKLESSQTKNYMTNTRFLDLRQQSIVKQAVFHVGGQKNCVFWGGYEDAERVCVVFLPEYMTQDDVYKDENSPIRLIRAEKKHADNLSHRDYLGSIMGLQIVRDRIGDILVGEHGADIIVLDEIADFLQMNLVSVGRKQISIIGKPISYIKIPKQQEKEGQGSVASLRLDSVIALIFSLSRSEAQTYIEKGMVFLNSNQCLKSGQDIDEGDKITVRTKGRCKICSLGGKSRKGRQFISYIKSV